MVQVQEEATGGRRVLLAVNGTLLALVGGMQMLGDLASYFFGQGPLGDRLAGNAATIGFVEAHGLAAVIGVLLVLGRRMGGARWHVVAAVTHLLLGGANLLFWSTFVQFRMEPAGIASTIGHGIFFVAQSVAALSVRPELVRGPGAAFRWATLATLAAGLLLHGTSLAMGREAFVERVFTPALDIALAVPMTFAGVSGWWVFRRARHQRWWTRALHVVLLVYFTVSIPVHLQTLTTGRTDYVLGFPEWYSVPILAILLAFAALALSLRFDPPPKSVPGTFSTRPSRATNRAHLE